MPYQKIDGTVTTLTAISASQNVDYNLHNVNAQTKAAYGLSVQVAYSSGGAFSWTIEAQCSNDGVNFSSIPGTLVTISANDNTIYDLGHPNYKILRIATVRTSGTVTFTLTYNAVNGD